MSLQERVDQFIAQHNREPDFEEIMEFINYENEGAWVRSAQAAMDEVFSSICVGLTAFILE